jgi:hypothetical protein
LSVKFAESVLYSQHKHCGFNYLKRRKDLTKSMAEREGFEPPIPLRVCLISSQVHSTGLCHLSATKALLFCNLRYASLPAFFAPKSLASASVSP